MKQAILFKGNNHLISIVFPDLCLFRVLRGVACNFGVSIDYSFISFVVERYL